MLRRRAVGDVLRSGVSANPAELLIATKRAVRRIGYVAEDVRNAVVEEYGRLISLDVPLNEEAAALLGGRPGQTLEELVYRSSDPLVDALHVVAMALYMEYADSSDWQRLEVFDLAAYAVFTLLQRGRATRNQAAKLLSWIADQVLS
jgi:ABC-type amino acid transport substrate-binding protein